MAISIFLGQIGKVFGFPMQSHGIIASLIEFVSKVRETHVPTLAVGLLAIAVMLERSGVIAASISSPERS